MYFYRNTISSLPVYKDLRPTAGLNSCGTEVLYRYKSKERLESFYFRGNRMIIFVPAPSTLSTSMVPPIRATACFTIDSQSPVPSTTRKNRSNTRFRYSYGIPIPVSSTISSVPSRRSCTVMVTEPFSLLYFIAFSHKL